MNATVIGGLIGGVLVFLSSIFVPIITKRMNKATDAAVSAEKISAGAEKNAAMALRISEGLEQKLEKTEERCANCLTELDEVKRRIQRRDRTIDSVQAALVEIIPLLNPDDQVTTMVQAVVQTIAKTRAEENEQ